MTIQSNAGVWFWSRLSFFTTTNELSEERVCVQTNANIQYSTAVGATDFFENCQQAKNNKNKQRTNKQFGDTGLLQQIPLYN